MHQIENDIFDLGYKQSLKLLLEKGSKISPRGLNTIELSPFVFTLKNPRTRIIMNEDRNINLGFNILEFLSIIAGDSSVEKLAFLSPNIKQFSDDGKIFRGAYGPRLRYLIQFNEHGDIEHSYDQFNLVITKLKNDKDSRQAIMTIFDPNIDYVTTKDVPCTVMFHFLIRDNKLNMNVYMRSNDAMLGHVIDVFTFTMIQEIIANELNCELGEYNHFCGSFHLYEKDIEKAKKIIDCNVENFEMPKMIGGLKEAEETYNAFNHFWKEDYDTYAIKYLNDYWFDLFLSIKYQILLKNKRQDSIDTSVIKEKIYKKYFERKLHGKEKVNK